MEIVREKREAYNVWSVMKMGYRMEKGAKTHSDSIENGN